ncbi:exonuclease 1 [Bombina bombina]|uniref:exonuclease 1 n=1 Tax=Bombina bombina TaxID=8345 RepID=UPI00235AE94E|nr:exonuclease 1 [Bombina bombina]
MRSCDFNDSIKRRQINLQKGKQLLREGKLSEARECFTRSVNITSSMAHDVIKAARSEGIDCIVAPYEADSELAYLNKNGIAQAIITEDSDLLAFGCKKVILKMDKFGHGLEIDQARLGMCKHLADSFTEEKFRYMCILSGCDYLPSIHGIGLVKACKLLKISNNPDILKVIQKIGTYLKMNITLPEGYIEGFIRANNTFLYQLVFDPVKRKLVPLNPYEDGMDPTELKYAGPYIDDSVAFQIAIGNRDIHTMQQIDDYSPDTKPSKLKSQGWNDQQSNLKTSQSASIWNTNYTPSKNKGIVNQPLKTEEKKSRRGLVTPCIKSMKRHQEDGISEVDLLSQYTSPKAKKSRKDSEDNLMEVKSFNLTTALKSDKDCQSEPVSKPKSRNKFSTFLQRRNENSGMVSDSGTRSRFFCTATDSSCNSSIDRIEKLEENGTANDSDLQKDINQSNNLTATSFKEEERTSPLSPHSSDFGVKNEEGSPFQNQRRCFSWSKSLHSGPSRTQNISESLQRFHRIQPFQKPNTDNQVKTHMTNCKPNYGLSDDSTASLTKEDNLDELENNTSELEEPGTFCFTAVKTSPVQQSARQNINAKHKVPGLHKSKSLGSSLKAKTKPLAPAKVSGLTGKGLKKDAQLNENKSGLQATINDLWKSFAFKKCEPAVI